MLEFLALEMFQTGASIPSLISCVQVNFYDWLMYISLHVSLMK